MSQAERIVIIVHHFPPINSPGAKRMEAMSKFFARAGRRVSVLTTTKHSGDGAFTEPAPPGVEVIELDRLGRSRPTGAAEPIPAPVPAGGGTSLNRRFKDAVLRAFGQIPDPRLPFALSFKGPLLAPGARRVLSEADVIVATCPPWTPLLAGVYAARRFGKPLVLEYRDHFSNCHEMPGGALAKAAEVRIDRSVARRADALVTISEPMSDYYRRFNPDVTTIMNGFDPERIAAARSGTRWQPRTDGAPLLLRYFGLITPGRVPYAMLAALRRVSRTGILFPAQARFEYYGEVDLLAKVVAEQFADIADFFAFLPRVDYGRALEGMVSADHLLFCENAIPARVGEEHSARGILTTKLFEYLACARPVLAHIGRDTLAGEFIGKAGPQNLVSEDKEEFVRYFGSEAFLNPQAHAPNAFVQSLSRAGQADAYLALLDRVVGERQA